MKEDQRVIPFYFPGRIFKRKQKLYRFKQKDFFICLRNRRSEESLERVEKFFVASFSSNNNAFIVFNRRFHITRFKYWGDSKVKQSKLRSGLVYHPQISVPLKISPPQDLKVVTKHTHTHMHARAHTASKIGTG